MWKVTLNGPGIIESEHFFDSLIEAQQFAADDSKIKLGISASIVYETLIPEHAAVVLTEDLPKEGLRRGQVGTVIAVTLDIWDLYTVEFSDKQGKVFARKDLVDQQLIHMRWDQEKRCGACGNIVRRRDN